ncbi:MAG: hypothetical protein PHG00_17395 [Methylococcales bacterium]|nr:hypothetical protein [Methylococcales bacterium]
MDRITLGLIFGLVFGVLDVLIMIPLKYENSRKKIEAMSGAFIERFMLGFLIPNVNLGINQTITGLLLGLGLSIPTAIITRAYAPIVGIGALGGLVLGFLSGIF